MLFMASTMSLLYGIMKKSQKINGILWEKWILRIITFLYIAGGLFYFSGGCAVAHSYNTQNVPYISGILFAEMSFVGLHGILQGMDLWKTAFLNDKKWRVLIYNTLFSIFAVVAFFSYAATSAHFEDDIGPFLLTLFYFFILIPEIIYLVLYYELNVRFNESFGESNIFWTVLVGSYLFCLVCLLNGYFVLVAQFEGVTGRGYFLGVGIFVVLMGGINACDMYDYIPSDKNEDDDGGDHTVAWEAANGVVDNKYMMANNGDLSDDAIIQRE